MIEEDITLGPVRLIRGDCTKIAPTLEGVDAVITDPPYGERDTHEKHLSSVTLRGGISAGQRLGFEGITEEQMVELASSWVALAKGWCVFTCEWKFCHALEIAGLLVRFGIWRKPDGAPQFTGDRPGTGWEAVACCHRPGRKRWNGGGKHGFWVYPKGENRTGHPTGKPVGLFSEFCSDFTSHGQLILDPYMGSGTTLIAAIRTGRRAIGIEIDPRYFRIAVERVQRELDQFTLPIEIKQPEQQNLIA